MGQTYSLVCNLAMKPVDQAPIAFQVKSTSGKILAMVCNNGDVMIKSRLRRVGSITSGGEAFVVKKDSVAKLKVASNGKLEIVGDFYEHGSSLSENASDLFRVKNSSSQLVLVLDGQANLRIKGALYEHANP
jgi:hypothetical protein